MDRVGELQFWRDALVKWPTDVARSMGLAPKDAEYLCAVGLPTGIDWNIRVEVPCSQAEVAGKALVTLAHDGPTPICVDLGGAGRVVAVEPQGIRPVNSNILCFGAFLMYYQEYRLAIHGLNEQDSNLLIDEIEQTMTDCDFVAMEQADNYWPVIVEQMRAGLL